MLRPAVDPGVIRLFRLEAKMSQLREPRPFDAAAPLVVECFDRGVAGHAVRSCAAWTGQATSSKLERVAAPSGLVRSVSLDRSGSSKAPLRRVEGERCSFGWRASFSAEFRQRRQRPPQPHNVRMKPSVKHKVPGSLAVPGGLSWC